VLYATLHAVATPLRGGLTQALGGMSDNFTVLSQLTESETWHHTVRSILETGAQHPWGDENFGTYWIVAGHRIREQVAEDRLLAIFLRQFLPPYGDGPVVLYRGENRLRFNSGAVGFSWSQSESVASMFARGLNAVRGGGLLLRAQLDAPAVIAGPNAHSLYLGEHQYTVDPALCHDVTVVAEFPSSAA
jgi:hypothetical protein